MKAKQLADRLLQYPTFDVKFSLMEPDGSSYGLRLKTFDVDIEDIGYSSEAVRLGPVDKQESNTRVVDPLLKEMAEALEDLIRCVSGRLHDTRVRGRCGVLLQKYHEQLGD